jgi:hypothetical protein
MMRSQKKVGMIRPLLSLMLQNLRRCLLLWQNVLHAALSQHDIGAYLESFGNDDDDESCSSDFDDFDDYGSEEEDEVGAVIDDALH